MHDHEFVDTCTQLTLMQANFLQIDKTDARHLIWGQAQASHTQTYVQM